MSERQSRAERRRARLDHQAGARQHAEESNRLRAARDAALAEINQAFREGVKRLEAERVAAKKKVWEQYDAEREVLIRAEAEQEKAAA